MDQFEVCIRRKSNSHKMICGTSTSGKITIDSVIQLDVNSEDNLLTNGLEISNPNKSLIVINDNTKTLLEPTQILDTIEFLLDNIDFDIFYLTRYMDECSAHTDFKTFKSVEFMKVFSPHGIEGLIISPEGKRKIYGRLNSVHGRGSDFILNSMSEKMNNYSSFPPLFNIDLSKRISDSELVKSSICKEAFNTLKPPKLSQRNKSMINFFWFIFFIALLFFLSLVILSHSNEDGLPSLDVLLKNVSFKKQGTSDAK